MPEQRRAKERVVEETFFGKGRNGDGMNVYQLPQMSKNGASAYMGRETTKATKAQGLKCENEWQAQHMKRQMN